MQENLFTKQSRLLTISIRLALSLALGILTVLLLIGLVSAASPSLALADSPGPGELDTTFGTGGVVTTRIHAGPGENAATSVAIQSDGKIVAVGYAPSTRNYDFAVVRYTVSGTLDTTFGSGGIVTTPIGPGNDYARDVAIQSDGKVVVAGYAHSGSDNDFAVVRYTVSGTLDTTFGSGGIVTTPIGPGNDYARDVAIQSDGKIVAAGSAHSGSDNDFAVVRYTVFGTLDTTFGSVGVVTTPIGHGNDYASGVAIQSAGKIVAAGSAHSGSDDDFAVVRYTVSGTLDTIFGSGGVVTTPIGPGNDYASGVVIQSDGKIVAAGSAHSGSDDDVAVVRYTVSGTLDTTFGSVGVVTTPIGHGNDDASGVVIQSDGKIVAAGRANNGSDYDFAVVRYTVSGTLDTTFGSGGVVTTPIGPEKDYASGVAIQSDGKIVAAGRANNGSDDDFAVVRYHAAYSIYLPLVFSNE
jgi:uncharacterized delta-60 repeat protein